MMPAHERRMVILHRACQPGGQLIHGEGGIAFKNRDLQKLMRDGYVTIVRDCRRVYPQGRSHPKWDKVAVSYQGKSKHGSEMIRRTRAIATKEGMALAGHGWVNG